MNFLVFIWIIIVIVNALIRGYLYPLYFELTPLDKINNGYLSWSENFKYQHSTIKINQGTNINDDINIHYRFDIQIKGLFRSIFKPLNFEKELKKLNDKIKDVNSIDPHQYFVSKKKGKIFF